MPSSRSTNAALSASLVPDIMVALYPSRISSEQSLVLYNPRAFFLILCSFNRTYMAMKCLNVSLFS